MSFYLSNVDAFQIRLTLWLGFNGWNGNLIPGIIVLYGYVQVEYGFGLPLWVEIEALRGNLISIATLKVRHSPAFNDRNVTWPPVI